VCVCVRISMVFVCVCVCAFVLLVETCLLILSETLLYETRMKYEPDQKVEAVYSCTWKAPNSNVAPYWTTAREANYFGAA